MEKSCFAHKHVHVYACMSEYLRLDFAYIFMYLFCLREDLHDGLAWNLMKTQSTHEVILCILGIYTCIYVCKSWRTTTYFGIFRKSNHLQQIVFNKHCLYNSCTSIPMTSRGDLFVHKYQKSCTVCIANKNKEHFKLLNEDQIYSPLRPVSNLFIRLCGEKLTCFIIIIN